MRTSGPEGRLLAALVAAFLVLSLAGQAGADALVDDASGIQTNRAVGRAASSYLTGFKTMLAAALWNRADPIMHRYYEADLSSQGYLVTSISVVQTLDPHLVHSYYSGSWILIRRDRVEEGLEMAERGVEANPDAGILWVNLAQLVQLYRNDNEAAVEAGMQVLEREMEWTDLVEKHNAYAILAAVFRQAGRSDLDARVQEEFVRMDAEVGDAIPEEGHDHDGDGVPDH